MAAGGWPDFSKAHPVCDRNQYSLHDFWDTEDVDDSDATSRQDASASRKRRHPTGLYYMMLPLKRQKTGQHGEEDAAVDEKDRISLSTEIERRIVEVEEWISKVRRDPSICTENEIANLRDIVSGMGGTDISCECCGEFIYTTSRVCVICNLPCCNVCCTKRQCGEYVCYTCSECCYVCKRNLARNLITRCYWCQKVCCDDHAEEKHDPWLYQCKRCYTKHAKCLTCGYKHRDGDNDNCELHQKQTNLENWS